MRTLIFFFAGLLSASVLALAPQERVENFRLFDHQGESHELYYYSDAKAIAVLIQGNGCPIVRNALPRFKELRDEYASKGVAFLMLNSNLQDNRRSVSLEAQEFDYDIPVLIDDTQIIGESLGLVRTGEVFVIDPQTWSVTYSGALDDRLVYENQKEKAKQHYLQDALDDMLDGRKVQVASADALGCLINFPSQMARAQHQSISYSQDIAPLLLENCASCHREGGIGPWAMSDYNMVRGFSLMMREVIRTKRMPPWHADPTIGHFSNDRSMTAEEVQTLVHWIEAGAPRGDGPDPLAESTRQYADWMTEEALGEPDFIIDIPAMEIPATGVVDYQYHFVENTVGKDIWVRAAEILPGDRAVLHHVITTFGQVATEGPRKGRLKNEGRGGLRGYAPGITNQAFPEDTGIYLPAGATFEFQMHYTPVGRATVDESKLGIWVYDEPPKYPLFSMFVANTKIAIPPNAKSHQDSVAWTVPKDAYIYNLMHHAHFRGKGGAFSFIYPDGTEEVKLSVPNYDFNWQTSYEFAEPQYVPAGTQIVQTGWWDNSSQNLANPDPTVEVHWGEQSWEEMLFGAFMMRFLDEEEVEARKTAENASLAGVDAR